MANGRTRHPLATKGPVYSLPGIERVVVRRDIPYAAADTGPLTLDIYAPDGAAPGAATPAVVFVVGYADAGARQMLGCAFKEMGSFVGWARLAAASGMTAITYETSADPASDLSAVLAHLAQNAAAFGIDTSRLGMWACSGHVPTVLGVLTTPGAAAIRCAALCYGYTLDAAGSTVVADASRMFRFATPAAGRSVADLPRELPLCVVKAGRDEMPGLNASLDRFVADALAANLPMTYVHHATGPHAFDLVDDSAASRAAVAQVLAFLRAHLLGA